MSEPMIHGALALSSGGNSKAVSADNPVPTITGSRTPIGFEPITVLTAAIALTVPVGAAMALIQAETQPVRWRDDGANPTASVGMLHAAGDMLEYTGNLAALRFIETAASGKLNVSYYK